MPTITGSEAAFRARTGHFLRQRRAACASQLTRYAATLDAALPLRIGLRLSLATQAQPDRVRDEGLGGASCRTNDRGPVPGSDRPAG